MYIRKRKKYNFGGPYKRSQNSLVEPPVLLDDDIIHFSDNPYEPGVNKDILDSEYRNFLSGERDFKRNTGMTPDEYYKEYPDENTFYKKTFDPKNAFNSVLMKYGGKIKYPDGGSLPKPDNKKREPVYVDDPKDPRLQMYNDSLDLYNTYKFQESLFGNVGTPGLLAPFSWESMSSEFAKDKGINPVSGFFSSIGDAFSGKSKYTQDDARDFERRTGVSATKSNPREKDKELINYVKKLNNPNIRIVNRDSPEFYHKKIMPTGSYKENNNTLSGGAVNYKYETKPKQEVVYDPNTKTFLKSSPILNKSINNTPKPTQPEIPKELFNELPMIPTPDLSTVIKPELKTNPKQKAFVQQTQATPYRPMNYQINLGNKTGWKDVSESDLDFYDLEYPDGTPFKKPELKYGGNINNTMKKKKKYFTGGNITKPVSDLKNPFENSLQDLIINGNKIEYKVGGKILKQVAAGAYGVGEGILDTVTMGATDQLTDKGFEALTKAGNKNIDLSNPDDVKFLKNQQKVKGYTNTAGAVGAGIYTGNVQGAIKQGTKGLNTAFQATDGLSDDFKQVSQGVTGIAGVASGFAGELNSDSFNADAIAGNGAAGFGKQVGKFSPLGNQAMGMIGGNQQPLWQQGDVMQEIANNKSKFNQANYSQNSLTYAQGGNLVEVNEGGTHEESPYDGVDLGDGLVEENETLNINPTTKKPEYVFPDRTGPKDLLKALGIKAKVGDQSFADLSKKYKKRFTGKRPNDPISKNSEARELSILENQNDLLLSLTQRTEDDVNEIYKADMMSDPQIAAYGGKMKKKYFRGGNFDNEPGDFLKRKPSIPMLDYGDIDPSDYKFDYFSGVDNSNNKVSINPNQRLAYDDGWRPEGSSTTLDNAKLSSTGLPKSTIGDMSTMDKVALGVGALGVFNSLRNNKLGKTKFERLSTEDVNPTTAQILRRKEGQRRMSAASQNITNLTPTSQANLANQVSAHLNDRTPMDVAQLGLEAEMQNVNTRNQAAGKNVDISMQETIANEQNRATQAMNENQALSNAYNITAAGAQMSNKQDMNRLIASEIGTSNFKINPKTKKIEYYRDGRFVSEDLYDVLS
jgi:hypothetical protein